MLMSEAEPASPTNALRGSAYDDGGNTPVRMNTPNAAGEQVDLLNAIVESSRTADHNLEVDMDKDLRMVDAIGVSGGVAPSQSDIPARRLNSADTGPDRTVTDFPLTQHQMPSDELAIQKEGLDILRNLTCCKEPKDSPKMLDHTLNELGQGKLFDLLISKLRPRTLNAFNRDRRSSEHGVRQIQPREEIIVSACCVIAHIAAGLPKHRQLLIAQKELLKLLVPLFHHGTMEVRASCIWVAWNLLWIEDSQDKTSARQRAHELKKLGFYEELEALEKDENLDCRDRSKQTREHMRELLRS